MGCLVQNEKEGLDLRMEIFLVMMTNHVQFFVHPLCMFWIGKYFRIHIKSSFFILDQAAQSYDRKYNLKYSMEKSCIQIALN